MQIRRMRWRAVAQLRVRNDTFAPVARGDDDKAFPVCASSCTRFSACARLRVRAPAHAMFQGKCILK